MHIFFFTESMCRKQLWQMAKQKKKNRHYVMKPKYFPTWNKYPPKLLWPGCSLIYNVSWAFNIVHWLGALFRSSVVF